MEILLSDYERMIYKLAHRAKKRLQGAGIDVDLEEIAQEGREIFTRSTKKFDPTRQVKFSTYLFNALNNSLNRFCDRQRDANKPSVSLTDTLGDDGSTYIDVIADHNAVDACEMLEQRETALQNLKSFTSEARIVLTLLIAPPVSLRSEVKRMQEFSSLAKKNGFAAPQVSFGVDTIMSILGYSKSTAKSVRSEISTFMAKQ